LTPGEGGGPLRPFGVPLPQGERGGASPKTLFPLGGKHQRSRGWRPSLSPRRGEYGRGPGGGRSWRALALLSFLALAACGGPGQEGKDCPPTARTSAVSGYCVPRYVSLKRDKVYARKGPGTDYPALWVYRAKGLPVQIVAETLDWRRVCDPDGGAVWVHRSMLDGRRTVEAMGPGPVSLLRAPKDGAPLAGLLNARALASLDRCAGGWCRLRVEGVTGWAAADRVWGVAPTPQCR
jgi:SH3-like domain-containing protein